MYAIGYQVLISKKCSINQCKENKKIENKQLFERKKIKTLQLLYKTSCLEDKMRVQNRVLKKKRKNRGYKQKIIYFYTRLRICLKLYGG